MKTKKDEAVKEIYRTKDYSKFKIINLNREIKHKNKILKSIKQENLLIDNPICVTKNYEIVDGQARFSVAQELKLDVYYYFMTTKPKKIINYIKRINLEMTTWPMKQLIRSGVLEGNKNYIEFNNVLQLVKHSPNSILTAFNKRGSSIKNTLAYNKLIWTKKDSERLLKINEIYNVIKIKYSNSVLTMGTSVFWLRAINRIVIFIEDTDISISVITNAINKNGQRLLKECTSERAMYDLICDIVNFNKKKNVIYFPRY